MYSSLLKLRALIEVVVNWLLPYQITYAIIEPIPLATTVSGKIGQIRLSESSQL
jgi:hypothetical protein